MRPRSSFRSFKTSMRLLFYKSYENAGRRLVPLKQVEIVDKQGPKPPAAVYDDLLYLMFFIFYRFLLLLSTTICKKHLRTLKIYGSSLYGVMKYHPCSAIIQRISERNWRLCTQHRWLHKLMILKSMGIKPMDDIYVNLFSPCFFPNASPYVLGCPRRKCGGQRKEIDCQNFKLSMISKKSCRSCH